MGKGEGGEKERGGEGNRKVREEWGGGGEGWGWKYGEGEVDGRGMDGMSGGGRERGERVKI